MKSSELLAALLPHVHDRFGRLRVVGRVPAEVQEVLVSHAEPEHIASGTLALSAEVALGPGISIGDAA